MARCQRTYFPLSGLGPVWECVHCPEQERYERVRDERVRAFAEQAHVGAIAEFGSPNDSHWPMHLILGLRPECFHAPGQGYLLYVQRGSDALQLRLQLAHEIFHRVCSGGIVFDWTHEMLACHFAVRLLRAGGLTSYADEQERAYRAEADHLPLAAMLRCDLRRIYPPGLYGRAFVTGQELIDAVGWREVRALARHEGLDEWRASLPRSLQERLRALTGIKELPG
jgi:hypothetical protein